MKFQYNDGGRAASGFKGTAGDCVCRSIAIATGLPYKEVYDLINSEGGKERKGKRKRGVSNARTGVYKNTIRNVMARLGWKWVPTMGIGTGCTVHLADGELPMGRLVVNVSKHTTAVIDGVIHDTHNPSDRATTIYPLHTPKHELPKGATLLENGNGYAYSPNRCVYGYFIKP